MLERGEIMGVVRTIIQLICGVLISRGLIASSDVEPIIGIGISGVTLFFSIRAKRMAKEVGQQNLEQQLELVKRELLAAQTAPKNGPEITVIK